jgi:hypothetical protein
MILESTTVKGYLFYPFTQGSFSYKRTNQLGPASLGFALCRTFYL